MLPVSAPFMYTSSRSLLPPRFLCLFSFTICVPCWCVCVQLELLDYKKKLYKSGRVKEADMIFFLEEKREEERRKPPHDKINSYRYLIRWVYIYLIWGGKGKERESERERKREKDSTSAQWICTRTAHRILASEHYTEKYFSCTKKVEPAPRENGINEMRCEEEQVESTLAIIMTRMNHTTCSSLFCPSISRSPFCYFTIKRLLDSS